MAIWALTVGTTGVALAQAEATEDAASAAVNGPSSGIDAFPTGYFVSVETGPVGMVMLEFHGDGSAITHTLHAVDSAKPFTYAVDGDLYTHIASEYGDQPTYRWDYDGERLAFELIGEETCSVREARYSNTFRPVEDPRIVVVAAGDYETGDTIYFPMLSAVPASEACSDMYTNARELSGRVAAVPITMGQPITPGMLEPLPAE
jgi:hypothetical protein